MPQRQVTQDNESVSYEGVDWDKIPNKYKRRPRYITDEELDEWKIPAYKRDYCIHHFIDWKTCELRNAYRHSDECVELKHVMNRCQFKEMQRMKAVREIREELGR
uniref:NADH dehydrogenase [ubiquinone] 1 beta subcomplex subunit 7 n=1 Tax=Eutreptiella gymnastica TaxID=73025 RepID=A0A7S4LCL5_9EUGL|eukprot:CAMPEP_0174300812 /NCGR_PEP_ID=MMETSP0809-20121228/58684_1 /TAXON_ID=73025 ORGANISM="Eutreptiella gymnastica-like, Strain CCMP1594" /NCGR_SAMPLE_ID=MMETSP0809 /ASSEMBLY_ACC=CAM_ASM_000658 /LENGTH=104 /DNA_ID=CAMNT_0015406459 /DNA_START=37 /DNA_END=351 /DNA_ORIENTATION=-